MNKEKLVSFVILSAIMIPMCIVKNEMDRRRRIENEKMQLQISNHAKEIVDDYMQSFHQKLPDIVESAFDVEL